MENNRLTKNGKIVQVKNTSAFAKATADKSYSYKQIFIVL